MHLSTLFNIISLAALAVVGGAYAQDDGPGFITKCKTPGQVALTFDDGPSEFTPKLLGYLAAAKVPATFFVLGVSINQDGGKEALKAAFDAGHQIALHSNTHADMNKLSPEGVKSEYTINLKAVQDTIGVSPAMARPPFGNCNAACAKVLEGEMGLTIIQWNCDSNDWQYDGKLADQPKLFTNMANIINPSNPQTDSFITLQHDIKGYSVEYVPKVIDMIKGKGYTFVTVEDCLGKSIPAYVGGASAPASDPAPAPAPGPDAAPAPDAQSSPAPAAYPPASSAPTTAAYAEAPSPSVVPNSADKFAPIVGLKLICLIFGYLMY
ncbi:Carbohydrate Esterase Family 4 protein [Glomus cerebriforme]|uniref:Carbohydrate Esterase Family 4 protein n=1 Tax=Glomus cerebriforme TaxID=658196 RepID=A0A397SW46_9GLOM|nr:Carbohydrate Esterase Family 4 protein [Glomus cerebriforme]